MRGDRPRLAGIIDFGVEEIVEAPVDLASYGVQHVRTLGQGQSTPGSFQRCARCPHRSVDLFDPRFGDGAY